MLFLHIFVLTLISLCNAGDFGAHHGGFGNHHELGYIDDHGLDRGHEGNHHGGVTHDAHGGYGNDLVKGFGRVKHGHGGLKHGGGHGKGHDYYASPKYEFGYGITDPYHGTNFGHSEKRDGPNTKGEYYVNLPDGRLQKVSYFTDEWGYHPTITYEGKAHFPSHAKGPVGHKGGYY